VQAPGAGALLAFDPDFEVAERRDRNLLAARGREDYGNVAGGDPAIESGMADAEEVGGEIAGHGPAEVGFQFFADLTDRWGGPVILRFPESLDALQSPLSLSDPHQINVSTKVAKKSDFTQL
jgi:hypothetical protein